MRPQKGLEASLEENTWGPSSAQLSRFYFHYVADFSFLNRLTA